MKDVSWEAFVVALEYGVSRPRRLLPLDLTTGRLPGALPPTEGALASEAPEDLS